MKKYFLTLCLISLASSAIFAGDEGASGNTYDVCRGTFDIVRDYYDTGTMPNPDFIIAQYGLGAFNIQRDLQKIQRSEGISATTPESDLPAYACKLGIVLRCGSETLNCRDAASSDVKDYADTLPDIEHPKVKAPRTPKENPNGAQKTKRERPERRERRNKRTVTQNEVPSSKSDALLKNGEASLLSRIISSHVFKATCAATIAGVITYYAVTKYNKDKEDRKDRYSKKRLALGAAAVVGASTFACLQYCANTTQQ